MRKTLSAEQAPHYWLMKSEPGSYSIQDLARDKRTHWNGVRNYQARNFMRDEMKPGDLVLFYHSNADPSGVAGIAEICRSGYPDSTAWDPKDHHFDPKSTEEKSIWYRVDVKHIATFSHLVSLEEIKKTAGLSGMMVVQKGSRLSVQPVLKDHFELILRMGK